MFDPSTTGNHLGGAEERLKAQFGDPAFQFEFYKPEDCIARRDQLQHLVDPKTDKLLRDLTQEEIRWIRAERTICRHDFRYWLERYSTITRLDATVGPCVPNIAQSIMLDIWAEHERQQTAIEEMDLKARQLGVTTLVQQYIVHQTNFVPNTHALSASADEEASHEMHNKADFSFCNMPWWMRADRTTFWAGERWEFGNQNSVLRVAWLNQKTGIARGGTPLLAHLSEVAYCLDPEKHIEASLMRAMHPSPRMMLVLESTANGMFNWWYKKWEQAIKGWESGASRLRPRFLPWFVAKDMYPTATWLRAHPVPEKWKPAQLTTRHAHRARNYVATNDLLKKFLGAGWVMPRDQMWWWENTREEYRAAGILNRFYTELPADDKEAFQAQQHSIFETELIAAYREKCEPPIVVYGLIARPDLIPQRLQPAKPQFDLNMKPVELRCRNGNQYKFQPLKFQGYLADPDRKLYIWELPRDNCVYGFGADTGHGISQDRSVVEVLRQASIDQCARFVAEFASDQVSASDLAPVCQAIGELYCVQWKGTRRHPKAVIESNSSGDTCQVLLRKMGYAPLHNAIVRYSAKKIDPSKTIAYGAFNSVYNRELILDTFIKAVRDMFIDIDSPWLIQEMATLGQSKTKKLQAEEGGFDDRVMAAAWVFISLHLLQAGSYVPLFGTRRLEEAVGPKVYDEWAPDEQYGAIIPGGGPATWPGAKWRM